MKTGTRRDQVSLSMITDRYALTTGGLCISADVREGRNWHHPSPGRERLESSTGACVTTMFRDCCWDIQGTLRKQVDVIRHEVGFFFLEVSVTVSVRVCDVCILAWSVMNTARNNILAKLKLPGD